MLGLVPRGHGHTEVERAVWTRPPQVAVAALERGVGVAVSVAGGGRAGTRRHRHADVHEAVGTVVAAPCGRCRGRSGSDTSWSTSISERCSRLPGHNDLRAPPTTRIPSATELQRKSPKAVAHHALGMRRNRSGYALGLCAIAGTGTAEIAPST